MLWEPIGITLPIGNNQAVMLIGTLNGVLYYYTIDGIKQPENIPVPTPVLVPTTEPVLKPIAQDIFQDMISGLAFDPVQQMIYSIKIEHVAAAVGLTAFGAAGVILVTNIETARLKMVTSIAAPVISISVSLSF